MPTTWHGVRCGDESPSSSWWWSRRRRRQQQQQQLPRRALYPMSIPALTIWLNDGLRRSTPSTQSGPFSHAYRCWSPFLPSTHHRTKSSSVSAFVGWRLPQNPPRISVQISVGCPFVDIGSARTPMPREAQSSQRTTSTSSDRGDKIHETRFPKRLTAIPTIPIEGDQHVIHV